MHPVTLMIHWRSAKNQGAGHHLKSNTEPWFGANSLPRFLEDKGKHLRPFFSIFFKTLCGFSSSLPPQWHPEFIYFWWSDTNQFPIILWSWCRLGTKRQHATSFHRGNAPLSLNSKHGGSWSIKSCLGPSTAENKSQMSIVHLSTHSLAHWEHHIIPKHVSILNIYPPCNQLTNCLRYSVQLTH